MLDKLPLKVIEAIFRHLTLKDFLNMSATNRSFYEICSNEYLWQSIFDYFIKYLMAKHLDMPQNIFKTCCKYLCSKDCGGIMKELMDDPELLNASINDSIIKMQNFDNRPASSSSDESVLHIHKIGSAKSEREQKRPMSKGSRRLQLLIKKAEAFGSNQIEDGLPGDLTGKYALKYRN